MQHNTPSTSGANKGFDRQFKQRQKSNCKRKIQLAWRGMAYAQQIPTPHRELEDAINRSAKHQVCESRNLLALSCSACKRRRLNSKEAKLSQRHLSARGVFHPTGCLLWIAKIAIGALRLEHFTQAVQVTARLGDLIHQSEHVVVI